MNMPALEQYFIDCMQQSDRVYARYARMHGLSFMSLDILEGICLHPEGITQKSICEKTLYPKQSVNIIIKNFLQQGYITLEEVPTDRRNKKILLTQKGKTFVEETVLPFWEAETAAENALTKEEQDVFRRMLKTYTDTLNTHLETYMRKNRGQKQRTDASRFEDCASTE